MADEVPLAGQQASLTQRLKRWLMNPRVEVETTYRALLRPWLARWPQDDLTLLIDRFDVAGRFQVLLIAVACRGRTLPVRWCLLPHRGSTSFAQQKYLLDRILDDLPPTASVTLMGDAEPKRARTYFQIGWRWLKQQARLERPIPFELLIYI